MTIDPELGKERHRQIDPLLGLGNNDGLPCEPATPGALSAMIPLNGPRARFVLHQLVLRQDSGIGAPLIGGVDGHLPLSKTVNHRRQCGCVTTAIFPVKPSTCTSIPRVPEPACVPFFLIECHLSSTSNTTAFPSGTGFS